MRRISKETATTERTCVVVSVYNAPQVLRPCLESVLEYTDEKHRIVAIDDASTDSGVGSILRSLADLDGRLEIHSHETNQGYTRTINHGCRLAERDDVVLLNSDTVVTRSWLKKLRQVAASRPQVATVTPLSNAAGAFSVPSRGRVNQLPQRFTVEEMAALIESVSEALRPEVPTGNGFCLYVRRRALDEVGSFDEVRFPHGCGEENDFCQRAITAGFVNLIDDSTFIYHRRSASLGWRKRWLLLRARWKLRRLHPDYERQVARWLANDPIDRTRASIWRALRETSSYEDSDA